MSIEVEVKQKLSPEMQAVADARENVRDMEAKVESCKSALKTAKAVWEESIEKLNEAIDAMTNAARQPSLFTGADGDGIPVNCSGGPDAGAPTGESQEKQPPRVVETEDVTVEMADGGKLVLALEASKGGQADTDHTGRYEWRIVSDDVAFDAKQVQQIQEQIAECRDAEPGSSKWGRWSEFSVTLDDGSVVEVLYKPDWKNRDYVDHFEFFGPTIAESGWAEHEETWEKGRPKQLPLSEWAREWAGKLAEELFRSRKRGGKWRPAAAKGA